jgi:hypothetical protein
MIKLSTGVEVPEIKDLSNHQLWQLCLTPVEDAMPHDIQNYLQSAETEFKNRKIPLQSIMNRTE